jgi:nucleoside-diphosphate-sugar epimerase
MSRFTVFGASGFIGRRLTAYLRGQGHDVLALDRRDKYINGEFGHGIYCIGMTADFRTQPLNTARAHIGVLTDLLESCSFESFLYLSSTRVYAGLEVATEESALMVRPENADHLYNVTKLAGETLTLANASSSWRVVRLSNVIGPGDAPKNFLPSLIADARQRKRVLLRTTPDSSKDYIGIADVVQVIEQISLRGRHRIYNVASGRNTSNAQIAAFLRDKLGAEVEYERNASRTVFPEIRISRLAGEFGFAPTSFEEAFEAASNLYKEVL